MAYAPRLPTKPLILRYKGICDFEGLYRMIVEYYKSKRFWFEETAYKHKVPSSLGAEQEIDFEGRIKVNDYISYELSCKIHLWDMTEVEVERNGVKRKLLSARIEFKFQGFVNIDYEKRWDQGKFWIKLKDFYNKYIAKEEIETVYWDTMHYRTQAFMNSVKEYLDMEAKGYEYSGYLGDNV